jgi:hypothetical protein
MFIDKEKRPTIKFIFNALIDVQWFLELLDKIYKQYYSPMKPDHTFKQTFTSFQEFCMAKDEAEFRALELSMRPHRYPWHMSERTRELSKFSSVLSKSLMLFNNPSF